MERQSLNENMTGTQAKHTHGGSGMINKLHCTNLYCSGYTAKFGELKTDQVSVGALREGPGWSNELDYL